MQAIMEKESLKLVKSNDKSSVVEMVSSLLDALENADNTTKNEIENKIVSIGFHAVPVLIDRILNAKGVSRGVASMSLIRIGHSCVESLKETAKLHKSFEWVADYLINEIEGSRESLFNEQKLAG